MSEKLWILKRCDLFERLPVEELQAIEARSRARLIPRGTPIYLPADAADSVLVLASGRAKICHITPDGKQSILAFIEPGELFGELSLIAVGSQREEYAETLEASNVVLIPGEVLRPLVERHAELSMGITKLIGLRRQRIERRLKNLLFLSNKERLCHLLLELARQYGKKTSEGLLLTIRLSHQDMANIIGSTRETVTVVLGELQQDGLLKVGRRKVYLTDVNKLAELVHQTPPDLSPSAGQPASVI